MKIHQKYEACEVEVVNACDLCGGKIFKEELMVGGWNLNRCFGCGLVFTSPKYTEEYLKKMYETRYYNIASGYLQGQLSEPSEDDVHLALSLLRICSNSGKGDKLRYIDVGCGGGNIVGAFQKAGWKAAGIDLSTKAINTGRKRGLDLRAISIEDADLGKFNLISAFHVLEHINSPKLFLKHCSDKLFPQGYLLVEVPNYGSRAARKMGREWPYLYPDGHLYQFTAETLSGYLIKAGFEIIKKQKVYGRGPLEDYGSWNMKEVTRKSWLKEALFEFRHLLYWSSKNRRFVRHLFWDTLGYGEFIRILARKK